MTKRVKAKPSVESEVLVRSRRRCCVCFGLHEDLGLKKGQLVHLDQDPGNNAADNLAFMCWNHHDEYDSRTSQSKGLTEQEVRTYRQNLYERLAQTDHTTKPRARSSTDRHDAPSKNAAKHALIVQPHGKDAFLYRGAVFRVSERYGVWDVRIPPACAACDTQLIHEMSMEHWGWVCVNCGWNNDTFEGFSDALTKVRIKARTDSPHRSWATRG